MIYQDYDMKLIPPDCSECDLVNESGWCLAYGCMPVYGDQYNKTRNEHCPLKSGSIMEWVDVRDRLPDFTGPVLVTVWDRQFNRDPVCAVKAATYKTKYKQFFRVQGTVIAWMPYPDTYRR